VDNELTTRVYQAAKAGLNLYRHEVSDTIRDGVAIGPREVEMAACGLFFLRDSRPESDEVFPMLPTFASPEDAAEQLKWWLAHDAERELAAAQAREAIRDRTFAANVTRLLALLDEL
jgi:spore maturation protein CgeB